VAVINLGKRKGGEREIEKAGGCRKNIAVKTKASGGVVQETEIDARKKGNGVQRLKCRLSLIASRPKGREEEKKNKKCRATNHARMRKIQKKPKTIP